ncbi:hypothetical protein GLOIN_2v1594767, partial [Rhizophagus irregularis DAOM 181602=DAOM 197198]
MKMNGTIYHLFILSLLSFFVFNTSASCVSTSCTCDGGRPQGQYCGLNLVILIATLLVSMNAIHKVEHVIMAFANPAMTVVVCNVLV